MKVYAALMMAVIMLMLPLVSLAAQQENMRLYVQEGTVTQAQTRQMLSILEAGGDVWRQMGEGRTLVELVLSGDTPDLAICQPAQAQPWAKEGLLMPLQMHVSGQQRMQRQALDLCVYGESLFMAPLAARHRQMAVNVSLMEEMDLGYMLASETYPVWYPAQFYQIMEEFLIRDAVVMDVWQPQMDSCAPLEALTQAIYGGMLLSEDGSTCTADSMNMRAGVQWLAEVIDDGMIGYCETQEEALERFLDGKTAIYIDWTDVLSERLMQAITEKGMQIERRPYPAAVGLPVRSFELVGACAFKSGEAARDAKLMQACAALHEAAQGVFGARGIWQDGAIWPASLSSGSGATLRSLFCTALQDVIEGGQSAQEALARVQSAMDVIERTK